MVACSCNPSYLVAEAKELLQHGRQRLQCAEIPPLHSSLGNRSETLSKKNEREKEKEGREGKKERERKKGGREEGREKKRKERKKKIKKEKAIKLG